MVPPHSRILDAGCGPGRTGAELHARGHHVIGVDADPELIEAAREDHPGPRWFVADLATLDLPPSVSPSRSTPPSSPATSWPSWHPTPRPQVLRHVLAHLKPDAFAVIGFHTDRYDMAAFDQHLVDAGFTLEHRFATWDLRPWRPDADFAVSVLRAPASTRGDPDDE